jgi:hypothetical protein
MPKYSKETERTHMERVRQILVFNPKATLNVIMKTLAEAKRDPLALEINYVNKLRNRIKGEQANRYHNATVEKELARFEDLVGELSKQLVSIMTDMSTSKKDRISAIREVRAGFKDLFEKKFDSGVFTRELGVSKIDASITAIISKVNEMNTKKPYKWQKNLRKGEKQVDVTIRPADIINEEETNNEG